MTNQGIDKLTIHEVAEMKKKIAWQDERLKQLQRQLDNVKQSKERLEMDFQHAIEQFQILAKNDSHLETAISS